MARKRTRLALSGRQLARLKRRLRSTRDPDDQKRLRVVCLAATGHHTLAELARQNRCARSTVQLWLEQFRRRALPGLLEKKSPPGRTSPMDSLKVSPELLTGLSDGRWRSATEVATWLKNAHDIRLTLKSVQRRLRAMGWDLRPPRLTSFKSTPASWAKTEARRREHQTAHEVLSYDVGAQAAAASIRAMERSRPGKQTDEGLQPAPIDVYLEAIFELLEKGECTLAQANRFVAAVRDEWDRNRLSG